MRDDASAAEASAPASSPVVSDGAAYGMLAAIFVVWGFNWPIMKVGLDYIPPRWFGAVRIVLAAATLFAILAIRRERIAPPRSDMAVVWSVGLLQYGAWLACVHVALQFVPAGRASLLSYTTPLWVVPGAIWLLSERLSGLKVAGLAAGLGGLAVLFSPAAMNWSDTATLIGNGMLLLAAPLWAFTIIHMRRHRFTASTLQVTAWQILVASAPLLLAAILFEGFRGFRWGWELVAVLLYNGCIATAFAYWLMNSINRALPAITVSLAALAVPAAGIFISALWLHEPVTPGLVAGLALIAAGLGVVAWADWRARKP